MNCFSLCQPIETQSTENEAGRPSDPYDNFLDGQKKRNLEWKATREAKWAKVQSAAQAVNSQTDGSSNERDHRQEDPIHLLRQQLTAKTEECP